MFEHPGIAGHFAFLQRLATAGVLAAAGPLTDAAGQGMTVIRAAGRAVFRANVLDYSQLKA